MVKMTIICDRCEKEIKDSEAFLFKIESILGNIPYMNYKPNGGVMQRHICKKCLAEVFPKSFSQD